MRGDEQAGTEATAALRERIAQLEAELAEAKAAETARERRYKALATEERATVLRIVELIRSSASTRDMIKAVIVFLRNWSGCDAVGIRLKDGHDFPYYETNGFPDDFLRAETFLCAIDPHGHIQLDDDGYPILECMCGNVIRGRFDPTKSFFTPTGSFWTNSTTDLLASTTEEDRQGRTRNRCNTEGYESMALVPLRHGSDTFGLLQFNDRARGHFTPEIIALLERLADSVATALAHQKADEERLRTEKLESLGILAGGLAHDFNNLLARIITNIEFSRRNVGEREETLEALADAERAAHRASTLTRQLLTLPAGGNPERRAAHVGEFLANTLEIAIADAQASYTLSIPDGLPPAYVDVGQLGQVIQNLALNAAEAMPDGGTVHVAADLIDVRAAEGLPLPQEPHLRITVADDGPGIPAHLRSRVFEPLYSTKDTGTGLGLAVCRAIIRKHDGHIAIDTHRDVGTAFHVYLPIAQEEPTTREPTHQAPTTPGARILFMDDEPIREMVASMLTDFGYAVSCAADGQEAIDLFRAARDAGEPFHAVILDRSVPNAMGGIDCMAELRNLDPDVRAILCSGYCSDAVRARCEALGFRTILIKPYTVEQLDQALTEVLKD